MQLLNISGWDQKFFKFLIMIFAFDLADKTCLLSLCVRTCRWAWSPRRDFSSDKPCWKVEGPWYFTGGACRWLGYYSIKQSPLFQWPLERSSHTVAETELQCMYHTHIHIHTIPSPNTTLFFFFFFFFYNEFGNKVAKMNCNKMEFVASLPSHNCTSFLSIICSCMVKSVRLKECLKQEYYARLNVRTLFAVFGI